MSSPICCGWFVQYTAQSTDYARHVTLPGEWRRRRKTRPRRLRIRFG